MVPLLNLERNSVCSRTPASTPLSPSPLPRFESTFHRIRGLRGGGEGGLFECFFTPGRRAQALALGYNPWPLQGRKLAHQRILTILSSVDY